MSRRVVVIGGGPVGVEAALHLVERGFDVTVIERDAPGAHVARWSHVRFYSPWSLNRSPWGEAALRGSGFELAPGDRCPTGAEYLRDYLQPLTRTAALAGRIRSATRVIGVTRRDAWKGDHIGKPTRADGPFLVALEHADGPEWLEADIVFDATGTYGEPARLGPGGLAAVGEEALGDRIERWIPQFLDRDRARYADKLTLVVGDGHSAATSLHLLMRLRESAPRTRALWLRRIEEPYTVLADDALPERKRLSEFGNAAARGEIDGIEAHDGVRIVELFPLGDQIRVTLRSDGGALSEMVVDEVVSNVGYRPEMQMTRELQVHHCWASEGPMKLAASLLAASGNADCLAQEAAGAEVLRNPEPNFHVVGAKSYGRNSNFLLRVGFEQIEAIAGTMNP